VQTFAERANTIDAAEAHLAAGGDFSVEASLELINFSLFEGGDAGLFVDDFGFIERELIGDFGDEYLTMEAVAFLELAAGSYTFGVNSDDGFRVTTGAALGENALELDRFDGGRGDTRGVPQNLFDVVAPAAGLYAFRLLYFQGTGDASVEWYQFDRETEVATLLNSEGGIRAFAALGALPEPLEFLTVSVAGDRSVTLAWTSSAGTRYRVEASPDLAVWFELADEVAGLAGTTSFTDNAVPEGATVRYYRVTAIP
jgi:hypothetical protein